MDQQGPTAAQKLPAGLAGVLNSPDMNRDSAYYSSGDPSSKHTSAASCAGISVAGPPSASSIASSNAFRSPSSQPDKTPSPTSAANHLPPPLILPSAAAATSMSVASMVSPTTSGPADLRRLADRPHSYEPIGPNASSLIGPDYDPLSRRESVDSRINQGFGDLRLGGNSPYASHNHSTTSVHSSLQQQRQPRSGLENLAVHRISNGYQPSADRTPPDLHNKSSTRTAPAITGPAIGQIARAAEPTKGQAWAFPEEEIQRLPSAASQSLDSRRSSIADSLASSQFTSESRLTSGQRRFEDHSPGSTGPVPGHLDYQRMSSEYPTTHHHALQHRRLEDLQAESEGVHTSSQPYSRTPELRISHKLAERKRRTEMKELFEQLRDLMPQERGSKASKWEILTKAITEHQRLQETVRSAQQHSAALSTDVSLLKNELHAARMENRQLRAELNSIHQANGAAQQSDPFGRGAQAPRPELPPLRSLGGAMSSPASAPDSMTGVQYEPTRVNGFRQPDRY